MIWKELIEKVKLENIQNEYFCMVKQNTQNIRDQRKYLNCKLKEVGYLCKQHGQVNNETIFRLILLNYEKRKPFLKMRAQIIFRLHCEKTINWINEQKNVIRILPQKRDINKIQWCAGENELEQLLNKLRKAYMNLDISGGEFKNIFALNEKEVLPRDNSLRRIEINMEIIKLCYLLKALNNPKKYINKDIKVDKYIESCKPLTVYYSFADIEGKEFKLHSVQELFYRAMKKKYIPPKIKKELINKIFPF